MKAFLEQIATMISGFFRWWGGELAQLVPPRLRDVLRSKAGLLILDLSGSEITVTVQGTRSSREIGRIAQAPTDAVGQASTIIGFVRKAPGDNAIVLRLPAESALHKTLNLPLAAAENLREVLAFEMDRHTPFTAEQVYFDFAVTSRHGDTQRMEVDLVTVPRHVVNEGLVRAAGWGVTPDVVDIGGAGFPSGGQINLLPDEDRQPEQKGVGRLSVFFAVIAVLLAFTAFKIPFDQRQRTAEDLHAAVALAKAEAGTTLELSKEVERLAASNRFLVEAKRNAPKVTEVIETLTRLLPDDTYLRQFKLKNREVRLSGHSAAASNLVGIIEDSPLFEKARFRSPVTQDARLGLERFNLSAEIPGGGEK